MESIVETLRELMCLALMHMTGPILEFRALATARAATEIRWIPGHNNITGNNQVTP